MECLRIGVGRESSGRNSITEKRDNLPAEERGRGCLHRRNRASSYEGHSDERELMFIREAFGLKGGEVLRGNWGSGMLHSEGLAGLCLRLTDLGKKKRGPFCAYRSGERKERKNGLEK